MKTYKTVCDAALFVVGCFFFVAKNNGEERKAHEKKSINSISLRLACVFVEEWKSRSFNDEIAPER